MTCLHDSRAVCWLCSDAISWWAEARKGAGVPHPRVTPAVVAQPEPVACPREPLRISAISEDEAPFIHHARGDWRHSNVRAS